MSFYTPTISCIHMTRRCVEQLLALRHFNGAPVVCVYGAHSQVHHTTAANAIALGLQVADGQGPVIAFNLYRPDGTWVGYKEVERLAALRGILLRTGCCCNPGACAAAVGLDDAAMLANHQRGHVCWDANDLMDGVPTGVVRASFGWMSSDADADALVALVQHDFCCHDDDEATTQGRGEVSNAISSFKKHAMCCKTTGHPLQKVSVAELWIYPVKSCRGQRVETWPLGPRGLLFDREWAIQDGNGQALTMKNCPRLAFIQAVVHVEQGTLSLHGGGRTLTMGVQEDCDVTTAWLTVCVCVGGGDVKMLF